MRLEQEGEAFHLGWDEPDWLGPMRPVVRAGVSADVAELADGVVVLSLRAGRALTDLASGDFATPAIAWHCSPSERAPGGAPEGLRAFGHQYTEFALPVFSDAAMERWRLLPFRPAVVTPLGLAAPDGRTILLAPLTGFHEQIIGVPAGREQAGTGIRCGWHGDIDAVDAGFGTELAIIAGRGARECFATWARLLRARSGIDAPARDADTLGTRVSYWTDNGSAYWYRTEPGLDPASTVVAAVDDLEARGLPVGAVQLDSWWYPHEVLRPFDTDEWEVPPSGMVRWEPRADVLPDGVAALRERLGRRPLVTHCRHVSAQSAYGDEFPMWVDGDRAHPQTPELYERLLDQAVAWGVEVFEHDWLIECFLGVRALRQPGRAAAWQEGIDAALERRALHAQWCMGSPADFAQASRLRHVTSIRTSGDHGYLVGPELLWAWFLHTNVMARALGLWPYKDVFHSSATGAMADTREAEALFAALSAGPVGVGDRIGGADIDLIRRTCRADGVLVRPDVPIAAIDRAAFDAPVWNETLIIGSAHSQHAAGRWGYVVTANVAADGERHATRVALADLGEDRPATAEVCVYDWRRGTVEILPAGGGYDVELDARDWDLRVVAPVLGAGVAVIGDPSVYACAGDARIAAVAAEPDGGVAITVLGAGERVTVRGWSRASGVWDLTVDVPAAGWTRVDV
jgi:hypothetical protein